MKSLIIPALLIAVAFLLGYARQPNKPEVLEVRAIRIIDSEGHRRAEFGMRDDGTVGLVIGGEHDVPRIVLSLLSDGSATLALARRSTEDLKEGISIILKKDKAYLVFFDEVGKERLSLRYNEREPGLIIRDAGRNQRAVMVVTAGGTPIIATYDESGKHIGP